MEVRAMNTKHTIGAIISLLVVIAVLFLTIRLSGHAKAGGVLSIGVIFINIIAIAMLTVLSAIKVLPRKLLGIYIFVIILSLIVYCIFHQSYDSYNESRRVFWGLNGE